MDDSDILDGFDFDKVDSGNDGGDSVEKVITFKHEGKEVTMPVDEAVSYISKGYNYTQKTQKIAPYIKLIELLESDAEALNLLDAHFKAKVGMVAPMQYGQTARTVTKEEILTKTADDDQKVFLNSLKASHDNYDAIIEKVRDMVSKEPLKVQILADQDVDTFMSYFNRAKKDLGGKAVPPDRNYGGGTQLTLPGLDNVSGMTTAKVWEKGRDEFDKMISKIKGY